MLRDGALRSNLIGFLDEHFFKHRMFMRGLPVLGSIRDIGRVYQETGFDETLIAQKTLRTRIWRRSSPLRAPMMWQCAAIKSGLIPCPAHSSTRRKSCRELPDTYRLHPLKGRAAGPGIQAQLTLDRQLFHQCAPFCTKYIQLSAKRRNAPVE